MRLALVTLLVGLSGLLAEAASTQHLELTPIQVKRIEQMTSYFENSTIRFSYDYVANLHDGRGLTVGRVGFCTGTGDASQVIDLYCKQALHAPICLYLPRLKKKDVILQQTHAAVADVSDLFGFGVAWKFASLDSRFRRAQDAVVDQVYLQPALARADAVGLRTPIARAIFFDTIIQQGETGVDSLEENAQRTWQALGQKTVTELKWLNAFLDVRRSILLHPKTASTQAEWADSVDRVDQLKRILNTGNNINLSHPVLVDDDDKVWTN